MRTTEGKLVGCQGSDGAPPVGEATAPESSSRSESPVALTILGPLDHSIGHISHPGPVHVRGDVEPDLTIFSTATIVVDGDVRGARLTAGDAIEVRGAIGGPGKARLDAQGDVNVGSARLAEIIAGGNVIVQTSLVQCSVTASGRVLLRGSPGQISGGEVRAGGGIIVRRLGSTQGRETNIVIGEAIQGPGTASLDARIRMCSETASGTARRLDQRYAQFAALPEGRGAVIQDIRRLIGERQRTMRLQASLVRQRRQAVGIPPLPEPHFEVGFVFPGVTLDRGDGAKPVPTTQTQPGGAGGK